MRDEWLWLRASPTEDPANITRKKRNEEAGKNFLPEIVLLILSSIPVRTGKRQGSEKEQLRNSMKILIVEDEPRVASFIKEGLEEQEYQTAVAYDGLSGEKAALEEDIDLILLDLILPGKSGIDVCRAVKEKKPDLPILMLTAMSTTVDKVKGFDAGADDYLVKPFDFPELLARIRSLLKRRTSAVPQQESLRVANLELDLLRKVAIRGEQVIGLTAKEFALLEFFMRNKGRVVSRTDISEKVWDITYDTGTNIVEVYVNILRKKIDRDFEPKLIHTRIGLGYIFTDS